MAYVEEPCMECKTDPSTLLWEMRLMWEMMSQLRLSSLLRKGFPIPAGNYNKN